MKKLIRKFLYPRFLDARLLAWHKRFENIEKFPFLEIFESTWQQIQAHFESETGTGNSRSIPLKAENALEALQNCIERGCYSPPEILLSISENFDEYKRAKGNKTLEECFMGKSKQRRGNYASAWYRKKLKQYLVNKFHELEKKGLDKSQSAEEIENLLDGKLTAETLTRYERAQSGGDEIGEIMSSLAPFSQRRVYTSFYNFMNHPATKKFYGNKYNIEREKTHEDVMSMMATFHELSEIVRIRQEQLAQFIEGNEPVYVERLTGRPDLSESTLKGSDQEAD